MGFKSDYDSKYFKRKREYMKYKLQVFASFDDSEQELFEVNVPVQALKSERALVTFILSQLETPLNQLYKLSTCWIGLTKEQKKKVAVSKGIERNGKYFFDFGIWDEEVA